MNVLEALIAKIVEYRQRRLIRRPFKKYLKGSSQERDDASERYSLPAPEVRHFQYVIVGLEDLSPEGTSDLMGKVLDAFDRHRAFVSTYSPVLIIGSFGTLPDSPDSAELRLAVVNDLLAENGKLLRIAHGQGSGPVGNLGSDKRFSYGPLIPSFKEIQGKVLETPFGTAFEVSEK